MRLRLMTALLGAAVTGLASLAATPAPSTAATTPLYFVMPSTSTLQSAVGATVGQGFQVLGGGTRPVTWSITSGALPSGLTLIKNWSNSSTMISGKPTKIQTATFTLQAKDQSGNSVRKTFTWNITAPAPVTFTAVDSTLPAGQVGVDYSWSLYTSGGTMPYSHSVTAGALPPGLTLTTTGGAVFGVPTLAGTYSFTARVVDAGGQSASRTFTIAIS